MISLDFLQLFRTREGGSDARHACWYVLAASGLTAAGEGAYVKDVYQLASAGLPLEHQKMIQRRIKEAILKTTVFCGVPRTAKALYPLYNSLSDEEIDHYGPRTESFTSDGQSDRERAEKGRKYFDILWTPDVAQKNRERIFKYHPDNYLLNQKLIYEYWMSEDRILSNVETQMSNMAALLCSDCPDQLLWHTKGLIRHGGTLDQARFAQALGLEVARVCGCKLSKVPEIDDIDFKASQPV